MLGNTSENLIYIAAAILLPLIPAYVLYRTLPTAGANVGGPLGSIKFKLSGASAGYFALVIIIFGFLYSRPKPCPVCPTPERPRYTVYKVSGVLQLDPAEDLTVNTSLTLYPRGEILKNGYFEFDVPVDAQDESSVKSLEISHSGYKPETIPLKEKPPFPPSYAVRYDEAAKVIQIQGPIVLKPVKPYSGGTELTPASPAGTQEGKQ
ncbi:MAG TPA: hypothetical protein VJT09_12055 [Pyrinomonadaceae bacterium]|nr:hypothetical protein [Pyrinomonadaceae bacterium]